MIKQKTAKVKESISWTGDITLIFENAKTGKKRIRRYKNLMTTAGKEAIARRLKNEALKSNECIVTYVAVGTGAGAPAAGDTTLDTELARKAVTSTSRSSNIVTIRSFFTTSEANGTLTEMGLFGEDASAAADSGTLFNHATIAETKTGAETLTVEVAITIS